MRGFMLFPLDKIGVYLDWRTQEVGIAGALSGDQALIDSYNSGDVYQVLALDSGLTEDTDRKRWKDDNPMQRQRMKALQLGVNYGMGVASLAKGLDQHPLIASNPVEQHRLGRGIPDRDVPGGDFGAQSRGHH
jgi:DNA polymerase I